MRAPAQETDRSTRLRTRLVVLAYALLACLVVPVYPHFVSPNEFGRWILAAAIVEDHALEVSKRRPLLGPMFEDLAVVDGRAYSNKAPGGTLVGLPGYLVVRPALGPPTADNVRASLTAMRLLAATAPTVLLGWLLVHAISIFGADGRRAPVALLALLFGTPLFAYGMLLFSHALVTCCLFGAFLALLSDGADAPRREVLGGALVGLAVLSEYPVAVPAAVLVLLSIWKRRPARLAWILLGGAPFAALFFAYNASCFGSPFALSYTYEAYDKYRAVSSGGFVGIRLPAPRNLLALLFHPSKGLFLFSPVLLLALRGWRRSSPRLPRHAYLASILLPAASALVYSGYPGWHGGWTVGPRFLLTALPFLVLAVALGPEGPIETLLLGASVFSVTLTSLVFPFVPTDFPLPWATFAAPLLGRGLVAPNLFHLVARPLAVAVPFLLVAFAAGAALGRRVPVALAGAALVAAVSFGVARALLPSPLARVELGYVAEVYFESPGALLGALPHGAAPSPALLRRERTELSLPPSSWPF